MKKEKKKLRDLIYSLDSPVFGRNSHFANLIKMLVKVHYESIKFHSHFYYTDIN